MGIREHLRAVPCDAWAGYAATACFFLCLVIYVFEGPLAFFPLSPGCFVYPAVVVVALVIAYQFAFRSGRRQRVLPLLLVSCILASLHWASFTVDLHLIYRIYLAGGPNKLNDWSQDLIRKRGSETDGTTFVEFEQVPLDIRSQLSSNVSVGGTTGRRVRIELGGGFYHYGVVVYPSDDAPAPNWWLRKLGWPAEVVIYHEE
jgi:hypothetical protein